MASHDKKILKYLQKNPSPPPSLIDLMGKLKMAIPDLTAGLDDLVRQGLIRKDVNADGIELYSLGGVPAPEAASALAPPPVTDKVPDSPAPEAASEPASPAPSETPVSLGTAAPPPAPGGPIRAQIKAVTPEAVASDAQKEPEPSPSLSPTVEPVTASAAKPNPPIAPEPAASFPSGASGGAHEPGPNRPKPFPNMPSLPSYQEQAPKGIGFFTFAIGLLVAAGFSAWIGSRLTRNEIKDATRDLVDKQAFQEAEVRWQEYQGQAKGLLLAVEEHMVTMTAKVDSLQAATDSLRVEVEKAHAQPAPKKRRRR